MESENIYRKKMEQQILESAQSYHKLVDFLPEPIIINMNESVDNSKEMMQEIMESLIQSERLATVGKLAAGVAHEIRNPLTALRGFCQLLGEKYTDDSYYFNIMITELDRINMIVNDFMTLSNPQIAEFKNENINKILQSVISILETQALLNNVIIVASYHEVPPIRCEEGQLKQVFMNVINNAIHAMPTGGEIKVSTQVKRDGYIQVSIEDDGIGIPEDILRRVGEPFFTTKVNGTGLGLMISRRIIENHNGLFAISSKVNQGTTVTINLTKATE